MIFHLDYPQFHSIIYEHLTHFLILFFLTSHTSLHVYNHDHHNVFLFFKKKKNFCLFVYCENFFFKIKKNKCVEKIEITIRVRKAQS